MISCIRGALNGKNCHCYIYKASKFAFKLRAVVRRTCLQNSRESWIEYLLSRNNQPSTTEKVFGLKATSRLNGLK